MVDQSMMTNGDREASFLHEIADALAGTNIGLMSIGQNDDKSFSIVILDEGTNVVIAFTHPLSYKAKDAFIDYVLYLKEAGA